MPTVQNIQLAGVELGLFDLSQFHPSGNKFFKLKYNLEEAKLQGHSTLLSFGGAWSNHLHALAHFGQTQGFKTIGLVRGEEPTVKSAMLEDAIGLGMELVFLSRKQYRHKDDEYFIQQLRQRFGEFYVLPEGGTNELAVKGAREITSWLEDYPFDLVCVPVGTGGTMAGLVQEVKATQQVLGFSVLKGDGDLETVIGGFTAEKSNWQLNHDFHCGGYARCPDYLRDFILDFEAASGVAIEPVYSAKMLFGLASMLATEQLDRKQKILAIHTGGLQGRRGFKF